MAFGVKMMVKFDTQKIILKFHFLLQRYLLTCVTQRKFLRSVDFQNEQTGKFAFKIFLKIADISAIQIILGFVEIDLLLTKIQLSCEIHKPTYTILPIKLFWADFLHWAAATEF